MLDPEQIASDARARSLRPPDDAPPPPEPWTPIPGALGPGAPDMVDETAGLTSKQVADFYESEIKRYSVSNDRPIKTEKGVTYAWVPSADPTSAAGFDIDGSGAAAGSAPAGKWTAIDDLPPTDPLFSLWNLKNEAKIAGDVEAELRKGTGAARSYLDTENDKTAEVQRQFKDFLSKANAVYDLQDAEQGYSMAADDQNIQNRSAQLKGLQSFNMTPFYSNERPGSPYYSRTVAETVPNQVLPDYQLNGAVGLPGQQGFNFSNLPQFAHGTDLAGVDPELAPLIGVPLFAGPMFEYGPDEQRRGFPDRRPGIGNAMRMRQ